jgi:hypothetical protein
MITLPGFLLSLVFSTIFGAAFHFWRGGNLGRLFLYLVLAWIGFWLGHYISDLVGITFATVGSIHVGMASVCAIIVLISGHWLFFDGFSSDNQ